MPDLTPDEFRTLGHLFVDAVADARADRTPAGPRRRRTGTVRARFAREVSRNTAPPGRVPGAGRGRHWRRRHALAAPPGSITFFRRTPR
ncbi:hypothetical protein HBB16_21850 [Pseudonocardia sp. MCCB 268]|nr:hypothetical protein [Pseudonocardia cytotoxica]